MQWPTMKQTHITLLGCVCFYFMGVLACTTAVHPLHTEPIEVRRGEGVPQALEQLTVLSHDIGVRN